MYWIICILSLLFTSTAYAETLDLDSIIIKASRSDDTLSNVTRPVSVITADDIAASPAKSLPELLGSQVGIYGTRYGNIKNTVVDLRGSGETAPTNVLILVDGRRLNQIDLSGQDWALIDLSTIERVEIIRGSGTVLYGDNAVGGVINIVTKKGRKSTRPSVTLSDEWGNYQTSKHGFEANGGIAKLDYQLNYAHEETTGFRANSNYWANDLNTRLGFDPTDNFGIDLAQGYHLDRYQLPGALFLSNIQQFGRRGVRPSLNNDHGWTSDSHFDVTPRLKFDAGAGEGEFSLFTTARKRANKFFTGSTVYETMYLTESYEFQPKVVLSTPLSGDLNNKATAGYDYFYAKALRRSGTLGAPEDLLFAGKVTQGVYVLDEAVLDDKWLVNAGVRGAWAQYVFDQKQVTAGKSKRSPTTEGYEGGLGYKYNANSKVYVDFSRSYRLPAIDEFFQNLFDFGGGIGGGLNTALTYQIGNQYEVGIKDQSFKNVKWGLNFFIAQYKNEIYLDPVTFNNTNYNARTRHYGSEAEASVLLFDGKVEPFVNLTLQEANFRGGTYGGNKIPFVPDQTAHAGVTYRPFERLSTSLSSDYVGKRFAISDQTNTHPKLKSYATLDWNVNYGLKSVELWVSLRNLLDTKYSSYGVYSSSANDIGYYPAPGRNFSAGVKVKF